MAEKRKRTRGIAAASAMRRWADKRIGAQLVPDGLDRSDETTLASRTDQWIESLRMRAFSPRTVANRIAALRLFNTWAESRGLLRPDEVDKPVLEAFQRWLWTYRKEDGNPLGVRTQRQRLSAMQNLFAWLCRENYLAANPAADLELPRKPLRTLPRSLSIEEVERIMAVPDTSDPLGIRDRAILETFYGAGLRRAELIALDAADIERERGVAFVRQGKGGKDRVVPLGAAALYWITRYMHECRPRLEVRTSERALFLSGYGLRLTPNFVGAWVRRVIVAALIDKPGSCHLLRHACATHMLEGGADVRLIQQLLGHANLDTTQIYTAVSITHLREVHARCHPRARAFAGRTAQA